MRAVHRPGPVDLRRLPTVAIVPISRQRTPVSCDTKDWFRMPNARAKDDQSVIDDMRMSFGDHLDELRRRVIWSLLGVVVMTCVCFYFGSHIIKVLTHPYGVAMKSLGFRPAMVQLAPTEAFIEYFKISIKFALVVSAPWVLYHLWKFVAVGLYPRERRVVRYFAPSSIILFVLGASFMVLIVLSGLMRFLISISLWFPLPNAEQSMFDWMNTKPSDAVAAPASQPVAPPLDVPIYDENPASPRDGRIWIDRTNHELNVQFDGRRFIAPLEASDKQQFVQPLFSISDYLGFVVNLALAFGFGFQIPIVVVFLVAVNIVEAAWFSRARKYIILIVCILAALLTPTPDIATMMMLAVPMLALFEIGLLIARVVEKRRHVADSAS